MSHVTFELHGPVESLDWVLNLGLSWVTAQQQHSRLEVLGPPAFEPWLRWFKVPSGVPLREPTANLGYQLRVTLHHKVASELAPALVLSAIRQRGILPEMLLSYLVQLAWTPSLSPSCRPLSEIVKLFQGHDMTAQVRPFEWHELESINATRLQELTPRELVAASREFWPAAYRPDPADEPLLEAWALLFVEHFASLLDVADHLAKFWYTPQQPLALDLPEDWIEQIETGALILEPEQETELVQALTGDVLGDLNVIVALLGPRRCDQRVASKGAQ